MRKVLKEVSGIDVAQKELVVSMGRLYENLDIEIIAYKVFKNTDHGIKSLIEWVADNSTNAGTVRYVMEATGVYHEKLAYNLNECGFDLSIVLPNKISIFFRTLDINTITDKTASQAIMRFGLERQLDSWNRPNEAYRQHKQLTRERDQIVDQRSMVKNQLHAEKIEALPNEKSLKRIAERIKFLNKQEEEIKLDIATLLKSHPDIMERVKNICTVPGVGELTAVIVLAETNGFELIRNKKQLTGYAGLDVREKQSGTSIKGKPRISKKGNRHLRKSLHLPSLSSVKYNESHRNLYARIVAKSGIKMKALIAVQRKILELIFVIDKNKTKFDNYYQQKRTLNANAESILLQTSL